MEDKEKSYKAKVVSKLKELSTLLAYISMGDFTKRIDIKALEDDEFAEIFCGIDVLMDDLIDFREELEKRNKYNLLRAEIWKQASLPIDDPSELTQTLFKTLGQYLQLNRILYFSINPNSKNAETEYQWNDTNFFYGSDIKIPSVIYQSFINNKCAEFYDEKLDHIDNPIRDYIKVIFDKYSIKTFLVIFINQNDKCNGFYVFAKSTLIHWTEPEKKILTELVHIISSRLWQLDARSKLKDMNKELEAKVIQRTHELKNANQKLHEDLIKIQEVKSALHESEEMYRTLINTSSDVILVTETDGKILISNQAANRIFGIADNNRKNMSLFDFVDSGYINKVKQLISDAKPDELIKPIDITFFNIYGKCFIGDTNINLLTNIQHTPKGFLFLIRDITEKRQQEEELFRAKKIESLGLLAGGIAHDFNNILTSLVGNIQLAQELLNVDQHEIKSFLEDASRAALNARSLTQQLLTFSKGGAPIKKVLKIGPLITDSLKLCLSGSSVTFNMEIPDNLHTVEADKGQLNQVFNNLIINAKQAMPNGGILTVSARNKTLKYNEIADLNPGNYISISIIDQGTGIDPDKMSQILDPYFSTKKDGTGLGLTSAYSIIKKHGGTLTYRSDIGKGSIFSIYLPACEKNIEYSRNEFVEENIKQGSILIMDDDAFIRHMIVRLLERLNYKTLAVENGEKAIEAYKKAYDEGSKYDLVIMDLTVPGGMGGKEAVKEILKIDPDAKAIVSSGYSNDPVMSEFEKYGFKDVVAKPFNSQELQQAIQKVISI